MGNSAKQLRLFIAVPVPENIKTGIRGFQSSLDSRVPEEKVSWVPPENIHLTLVFLGNTPETAIERISQAAREAAQEEEPFHMEVGSGGAFPSPKNPRILWVGINGAEPLCRIKERLDEKLLERAGIKPEKRKYTPHLTIARVRRRYPRMKTAKLLIDENPGFGSFKAESLELIESILQPSGVRYRVLEKFEFV